MTNQTAQVLDKADRAGKPLIDVDDPSLHIDRELSMIQLNQRVLEEARTEHRGKRRKCRRQGQSSPSAA